jgi:cytochrome c
MDSFEINKLVGALLGTLLFAMGLNIFAGAIYATHKPVVPGYDRPAAEEAPAGGAAAATQEPAEPLPVLLSKADPAKGEKIAQACTQCHIFQKSGPKKPGPPLFGVVGRQVASVDGFSYSAGMKAKGGTWDPQHINEFITNPRKTVPGTNMTYGGLGRPQQRADLIAFLNSLSDNPQPLPKSQ